MKAPWLSALNVSFASFRTGWPLGAVLVLGIALSTLVISWLLALRSGFVTSLQGAARDNEVIVLRRGANSEIGSFVPVNIVDQVASAASALPGLAGAPLVSKETLFVSEIPAAGGGERSAVGVRGVGAGGLAARGRPSLREGRWFATGTRELVVGQPLAHRLGLAVGQSIQLRNVNFQIVGTFVTGDAYESEIWADLDSARNTFRQMGFQSVLMTFMSTEDAAKFVDEIRRSPRLGVTAWRQTDYLAQNGASFPEALGQIAMVVGAVMAIALSVNAGNSVFALAHRRRRATAVLLAVGFRPRSLATALLIEALALAVIGSLAGWTGAWALFDGRSASTLNPQSQQQVLFTYSVGWDAAVAALGLGIASAVAGALFAAVHVARTPLSRILAIR